MEGTAPVAKFKLRELGIDVPAEFALFPPLILDRISADWAPEEGGINLLAHYRAFPPENEKLAAVLGSLVKSPDIGKAGEVFIFEGFI